MHRLVENFYLLYKLCLKLIHMVRLSLITSFILNFSLSEWKSSISILVFLPYSLIFNLMSSPGVKRKEHKLGLTF